MIRLACETERAAATSPYVILVVPLLFESAEGSTRVASSHGVQRTLVVSCDERVQIERVMRRSRISEAEVRAIIATQMPTADRVALADDVIDNSGPPEALDRPIERLHAQYLKAALDR